MSLKAQKDRNLVFVLIGTAPGIDLFRSPIHGVMMMIKGDHVRSKPGVPANTNTRFRTLCALGYTP